MQSKKIFGLHIIFLILLLLRPSLYGQEKEFSQTLAWEEDPNAFSYRIEIQNLKDNSLQKYETSDSSIKLNLQPGEYKYKIYALDFLGRDAAESDWQNIRVIKALKPVIEDLPANLLVAEEEKVNFSVPVDVSSITEESSVLIINTRTKEEIKGSLEFISRGDQIIASNAIFPQVSEGNWVIKITNPSGLTTQSEEIQVTKTVEEAFVIADENPEKRLSENLLALKAAKEEEARLAQEKALEEERLKAEKLAQEEEARLAQEKLLEEERLKAEKLAQEEETRLAQEKLLEEVKLKAEKLAQEEAARLEEEKLAKEKEELARAQEISKAQEKKLMEEKIAQAKEAIERIQEKEDSRLEEERIAQEEKAREEAEAARRAEEERLEREAREAQKKLAQETLYAIRNKTYHDINFMAGAAAFFPLYGNALLDYSDLAQKLKVLPFAQFSISYLPIDFGLNRLGFEVNFQVVKIKTETDYLKLAIPYVSPHYNFYYQQRLVQDKLFLGIRAGASITIFGVEVEYKDDLVNRNDSYEDTYYIFPGAQAGISLIYRPDKFLVIELGCELEHIFMQSSQMGLLKGFLNLGLRI
ncbi:MAG: hypothetical protein K5866_00165 [Treponema sp.]|nr:hypothetical protein [Treponema sp.]